MTKKKISDRFPTPYEVRRDFLRITSNVILTSAIILLMIVQTKLVESFLINIIILLISLTIIFLLLGLKKFYSDWVKWSKKIQ